MVIGFSKFSVVLNIFSLSKRKLIYITKNVSCWQLQRFQKVLCHNISLTANFVEYEENINKITILKQETLKELMYYACNLVTKQNFQWISG